MLLTEPKRAGKNSVTLSALLFLSFTDCVISIAMHCKKNFVPKFVFYGDALFEVV